MSRRLCCILALLLTPTAVPADLKWIDLDGVKVPEPPAEHPRLYLRARDLPAVRQRMVNPILKPVWEELQAEAKINTQIRLEVRALRYLLDGDAELGRRTIADVLPLLERAALRREANESRNIGRMMDTGAIVYDWCYPVLTKEQKQEFITQEVRLAKLLECGYPPDKRSFVVGHPSEWMILRDLLSAGIALYDDFPEMYRVTAHRIFQDHIPARNWWYPGGAFSQGPGYSDARWLSDMYALFIFDRMGAGNVFNPSQQFVPYEWIYLRRPDGQFMRSADGQNWPTRFGSLLTASYYNDGYVYSNFLKDPHIDPDLKRFNFLWPDLETKKPISASKMFEFLWRDPNLKPLPLTDLPLSRYFGFPYGWMAARTGWGESSAIAQMRVSMYNFSGHQHDDAGTFDLYYKGPLAIHSGVYQGINGAFGSPHFANYYQRTIAHNGLLILDPEEKFIRSRVELQNGGGERLVDSGSGPRTLADLIEPHYRTGTVDGEGFGPDPQKPHYTYLKGDITAAYSAKVKEVKRSFVFLNLASATVPAALVVFDRVVSSNPSFRKYWLLQSVKAPHLEENADSRRIELALNEHGWTGKVVTTTLLPTPRNSSIETVGGPGKEFYVFGKNFPNSYPEPDPEVGGWRVQISPKEPSALDLFLNVLEMMDGAARPLPVEKIETRHLAGMHLADRVVLFDRESERLAEPVSFAVTGGGSIEFLVAGLAAGTWQIWRDGRILDPAINVSSDAGTLYFTGPAGAYNLRR